MNKIDGTAIAALDGITLDQLRIFICVVDTGTFSAAGRRLGRVQSAVSHSVAALERQLGFALFDRSARIPTLTAEGTAMLAASRSVSLHVEQLQAIATRLRSGTEPAVSMVVESLFPTQRLANLAKAFGERWPCVAFKLRVETLGAVLEEVRCGRAGIGVAANYEEHRGVVSVSVGNVRVVSVVAPGHPLASLSGQIPTSEIAKYVQIVLSGRGTEQSAPDRGVLSHRTWRVADMETREALIAAGLGWGNLPSDRVESALACGRLVAIFPEAFGGSSRTIGLVAVWLPESPPGPAGRWLVDQLSAGREA